MQGDLGIEILTSEKVQVYSYKGIETVNSNSRGYCFYPLGLAQNVEYRSSEITSDSIHIYSVDSAIVSDFHREVYARLDYLNQKDFMDFCEQTIRRLSFLLSADILSADVNILPPCLKSTAYNYYTDEYVGLHIDTHDEIENQQRKSAPQLLSINMGKANRFLHFVNLTYEKISALTESDQTASMKELVERFFRAYPRHEVYSIEIPPGHGYLARTQNIIHDGGTNSCGEEDISLFIGGNYKIDLNRIT